MVKVHSDLRVVSVGVRGIYMTHAPQDSEISYIILIMQLQVGYRNHTQCNCSFFHFGTYNVHARLSSN